MKKAWELEYEIFSNAKPVILSEEEQTWDAVKEFEKLADISYKMKWNSNVPGSGAPERVIVGAIQSMENMGYDVTEAEKIMYEGLMAYQNNNITELIKKTTELWYLFGRMPKILDHPYHRFKKYHSFTDYKENVVFPKPVNVDIDSDSFYKSTYYGWIAQFVGGAFGTAMEGYTTKNLKDRFGDIHNYIREPNTYNDDVTYEIAFLEAFSKKGKAVTSIDIALEWVALVPFGWSAEEIGLKNIQAGIMPPESGFFNNPYREWIGAQMRGAICGMVSPGNVKQAAELAFKDGIISHHNNGVIGEVFNAMMVSMAYIESNVTIILEDTIELLPNDSEYYSIVKKALIVAKRSVDWQTAWEEISPDFIKYNWIHAYPNAAAEVIALWFGQGDFDKTLHIIGMMGYDVDCNAAQIMTIIGIIQQKVSDKWKKPLGKTIYTYCRKYKEMTFEELTKWTVNSTKNSI